MLIHSARCIRVATHQFVEHPKHCPKRGAMLLTNNQGRNLKQLLSSALLNPLVGGVKEIAIGDQSMRERRTNKKRAMI